jgi:ABC-type antimicrobial peptide transport system permease subunit
MVLRDALGLVMIGLVIGVPLALLAVRALQSQLHDVRAVDPTSVVVAVTVLFVSGVIAVLLPAFRAARISPIVALRES